MNVRVASLYAIGILSLMGCNPNNQSNNADAILLAAGDIGSCGSAGLVATGKTIAEILKTSNAAIVTLGDNAYPDGTADNFSKCYDPYWGSFRSKTRPAPGNHDYHTAQAKPYFDYFGNLAGEIGKGYYSFDLGAWHIIAINSNCSDIGGCNAGSAQEKWLRADLASSKAKCTLAYWHHPRFSSGTHGNSTAMQPIWQALYEAGADVVLNGHDHTYERFALQDPTGKADSKGIREFVVGTGGAGLYARATIAANSESFDNTTFGILQLTLKADSYDWKFIASSGGTFTDTGSAKCN